MTKKCKIKDLMVGTRFYLDDVIWTISSVNHHNKMSSAVMGKDNYKLSQFSFDLDVLPISGVVGG